MAERISGHTELIGLIATRFVIQNHQRCTMRHSQSWDLIMPIWRLR